MRYVYFILYVLLYPFFIGIALLYWVSSSTQLILEMLMVIQGPREKETCQKPQGYGNVYMSDN